MTFVQNILNTISKSEAFLIVISGVLIYTTQQLISQLWIKPIEEFRKCIARIETTMNRWDFLYKFTEGKTGTLTDAHGSMDERIKSYRKELSDITTELIYSYNSLPTVEKWYLKKSKIDVKQAKSSLLTLSIIVANAKDWESGESKAEKEIINIYRYLKLSRYLQS